MCISCKNAASYPFINCQTNFLNKTIICNLNKKIMQNSKFIPVSGVTNIKKLRSSGPNLYS